MTRTKRHTNSFVADPDLEFEFYLAEHLGMTVARMRAEMGNDEYVQWGVYFGRKAQRQELARMKAR